MKIKLASLFRSQGLKSAALVTGGNISATVIAAIAMILFSRLLGPEQFGVFSVLFSLLLILSKVGDAGINIAVQREVARRTGDDMHDIRMIQTGSALKGILSAGIAVIGLASGAWVGRSLLHIGPDSRFVPLVFLLTVSVILYEYVNTVLQAKQFFGLSVVSNYIQSLGKLAVAIAMYSAGVSLPIVILAYLLLPALGAAVGFVKIPPAHFIPKLHKGYVRKIIAVAKWTSIAILSATLADNVDVILVQNYLTSYDTGLWSAAVRIATLASLIGWSIGTVVNVRVASYGDKKNLHSYLRKALILALGTLIGVSGLVLFSGPLISITVGSAFLGAVPALNLLFISTAILTAATPYVALFYLFDKPAFFAWSGIISTVVLLAMDVVLIPQYGLMGAGYARIVTRLAGLLFTLWYARRAYRERYE